MRKGWLTEREYSSIYSRVPRVAVDLVIGGDRGVLLTRRAIAPYVGYWHLPGGRVFFRESLEAAVKRIGREELDLRVQPIRCLGVIEFLGERQKREERHTVSVVFLAEIISGSPVLNHQSSRIDYFFKSPSRIVRIHKKFLCDHHFLKK